MAYTELEKTLARLMRDGLRSRASKTRLDGDGQPGIMEHLAVAHDVLGELRKLGWTKPDFRYHAALHKCGERYRDMLAEADVPTTDPLWVFTMEFMFGCRDGAPVCKLNRWLGYIQGALSERGYTTVEAERDWTRPLFRPLDFPDQI